MKALYLKEKDVEELLKIQIKRDEENRAKRLEENKKETKKRDFSKKVKYQIMKSIINPLEEKMNEFNKRYHNGKIKFGKKVIPVSEKFVYEIKFISGIEVRIHIEALYDYTFEYPASRESYFDVPFITKNNLTRKEVPKLKGRKILAWGFFRTSEGKGFNLFLVEKADDIYGDWLILENRNSALSREKRSPEPFSFEVQEFKKELPCIDAMHIYESEIIELNIKYIIDFFKELMQIE